LSNCISRKFLVRFTVLICAVVALGAFGGLALGAEVPSSLKVEGLRNAFRVTDRLFCGGHPEGEGGFAELARLGVKTVVSVDGNKPDLITAHKYGLRYIHLPFGYGEIPRQRIIELVSLAKAEVGPIYVHCHNGRYRAPAAVAVMRESMGGWSVEEAEAWLKRAGKGNVYEGLGLSVKEFKQPTVGELVAVGELPEVGKTTAEVDAMVAIDSGLEILLADQKVAGQRVSGPRAEAVEATRLILEQFRELRESGATAHRPPKYQELGVAAEKVAEALRSQLMETKLEPRLLAVTLNQLGESCSACHQTFRNQAKVDRRPAP